MTRCAGRALALLRRREAAALRGADRVIDLDDPAVRQLGREPSALPGSVAPDQHVHELLRLRIGPNRYLAKSEDVLIPVDWRNPLDYRSFFHFAYSIFSEGEGETPLRRLEFPDDPEIASCTFHRRLILENPVALRGLADETPPGAIENAELRALFVLYTIRKKSLERIGDARYENVFNHHGRDILFENFASVLGRLLGVRTPRNLLGFRRHAGAGACEGPERYVLSRSIGDEPPGLDEVLDRIVRSERPPGSEFFPDLSRAWRAANPLSLRYFEDRASPAEQALGDFVRARFARADDLIRSDVLDRLLAARGDRKIQEFLAPRGTAGPLYTVDYGEVLFPELQFAPDEAHYLRKRDAHAEDLNDFLRRLRALPPENGYRRPAEELLHRFAAVSDAFFREYFARIPALFFRYHAEQPRPSLRADTLNDFFEHTRAAVQAGLGRA